MKIPVEHRARYTRRLLIVGAALIGAFASACGQVSVRTATFSFEKPLLNVKASFLGENGNSFLAARETGTLAVSVTNTGSNVAHSVSALLYADPVLKSLQFDTVARMGDIKPGETRTAKVAVLAPDDVKFADGLISVDIKSDPPLASAQAAVAISLREVPLAHLEVRLPASESIVPAGETVTITAQVRNSGSGASRNITATAAPIGTGTAVSFEGRLQTVRLGPLEQGASRDLPLTVKTAAGAAQGTAAFVITLKEERRKSAIAETLSVAVRSAGSIAEEAALAAFRKGDYIEAIRSFEKVTALGKASREVYYSLGVAYFRDGNPTRCLSNIQKAARMGSGEAGRWLEENTFQSERVTVTYTPLSSDPFEGYAQPIGLGILAFKDSLGRETALASRIYDVLKARNKSFRIFPYSTIKEEQASLGIARLDGSDRRGLAALEKDLSVNFVLSGISGDSIGSSISLRLVRSRDASIILTREFRSSTSSTALDDVALFLLKKQSSVYHTKQIVSVKMP